MVLKSASVLSCLLPARLGFGNHSPDSLPRTHESQQEKHAKDKPIAHDPLGDPESGPLKGNSRPIYKATDPDPHTDHPDLLRARANTAPSDMRLLIPNGGIGESPSPAHRSLVPSARPKRSSFTTFFAFSPKRRSTHGASSPTAHLPQTQQDSLIPPQSVSRKRVSDDGHSRVHLVNPGFIPSPLKTDEEEYHYSYYASLTPTFPYHTASAKPDAENCSPSRQLSLRPQDLVGNPDLDSQFSPPVNSHLSHVQIRHPYAYSTSLHPKSKTADASPRLRHATSQPLQHHLQGYPSGINMGPEPSSQLEHEASKGQLHHLQSQLKLSMSTPNLTSGAVSVPPRSLLRKKPSARSKGQERWLSAETWWDALFSPSPRFKVKQAPRPCPAVNRIVNVPIGKPVQDGHNSDLGITFPSIPATRPRAVSVTSAASINRPPLSALTRSRSVADLSGQTSTSAAPYTGFGPALETLVDRPTPPPDQATCSDFDHPLPDPFLSLEQVLDEGEAFEQQRARWKQQASKSIGNKHTRSFSRARSKSLGERHVSFGRNASECSKAQLNLEFLTARTLLGSQSTMPTVHVTKYPPPHSKAYSHSYSQSAHSHTHSSHSRACSHSHSHSLTTSNSSKSSRNHPRSHSRNGSWGKTAFLKAGALCGIGQDESYTTDERVPSSSRIDVQDTIIIGHPTNAEPTSDADKVSPSLSDPNGEVGIAISSSPAFGVSFDVKPRYKEGDQESRWSSKYTYKSSEYAGPHPSAIDSNLPQLGDASDVSLRHRLPPRAAIHPPIVPIAHPYRSTTTQSESWGNKGSQGATSWVADGQGAVEPGTGRIPYLSLSHADFEQYGVGEALVYTSLPRPEEVREIKQTNPSPAPELSPPLEQLPSYEVIALRSEGRDPSSLAMNSVLSLTNSTIQMVMSAFSDPDDLDEFQDLFYKPQPASEGQHRELSEVINQVPTDVHGSTSSSPLVHLVCKLSEEVNSLRDSARELPDPMDLQRSESQDHRLNENQTKFVFMDVARLTSSPPPSESPSQLHVPIQERSESAVRPVMAIPEDINVSCTSSVLDSPSRDHEDDTFGYPIKHGQLEAATAPTHIPTPIRTSTHLSIQEDEIYENGSAFLSPVTRRFGLASVDAVRASYLTTSDLSQMSGLSDFPLPPGARPVSVLHVYSEATPPPPSSDSRDQSEDETEIGHGVRHSEGEREPTDDVEETLRALRTTPRITSYESHRSTFGGSNDTDIITELHQACR